MKALKNETIYTSRKLISWIFFILRYVGVLMKICSEIKHFLKIMYGSNFTAAGRITNFPYFSQILLKGILKQTFWSKYLNMNI